MLSIKTEIGRERNDLVSRSGLFPHKCRNNYCFIIKFGVETYRISPGSRDNTRIFETEIDKLKICSK